MRYALLVIYAMIGSGVTMGIEIGKNKDLNYPMRVLFMTTWPIPVFALITQRMVKDINK